MNRDQLRLFFFLQQIRGYCCALILQQTRGSISPSVLYFGLATQLLRDPGSAELGFADQHRRRLVCDTTAAAMVGQLRHQLCCGITVVARLQLSSHMPCARNHQLARPACLVSDICHLTVATSRDRPALATPPTQRSVGLPSILLAHCSRKLLAPPPICSETLFWWVLVFLSTNFIPFQNLFSLDFGFQKSG
ncbi:unnamed protein product [Camellia sinensis]